MSGPEALGMFMLVLMIGTIFIGFPISFTLLILINALQAFARRRYGNG